MHTMLSCVAAALVMTANVAAAAPAAAATASDNAASAHRIINMAKRTHATAQAAATRNVRKGEGCRELVRAGVIPGTTMDQYKCILSGPKAAEAAARAKASASQPTNVN